MSGTRTAALAASALVMAAWSGNDRVIAASWLALAAAVVIAAAWVRRPGGSTGSRERVAVRVRSHERERRRG
ncbi:MAG: hypothetical protein NTZ05_18945 [Chloroflexi bacterium]|nr:hypothetical protein [Chloroflexota bacterium]